jgi:hypothetical protein
MWFAALLAATALGADALLLRHHEGLRQPSHSPVTKVMLLLSRIQTTIENEGKEEAKAYDKFACFCKEQADEKQYAIEKAQALEDRLGARIEEAVAEKDQLDANVATLQTEVDDLIQEIADENATRTSGHAAYVSRDADLERGLEGIEQAIAVTKGDLKEREPEKGTMLVAIRKKLAKELRPFVEMIQKQTPGYKYDYQSMSVVETVETLKEQFTEAKKNASAEELTTQQGYEMAQGGRENLKTAKLHSQSKQNATSAELAVEIAEKNQTKLDTQADREADHAFLQDITVKCERKAEAWDARSTVRSGELEAIAKAMEILKGARDTAGALDDVGRSLGAGLLAKGRKLKKGAHLRRARAVSFVQVATKEAVQRGAAIAEHTQQGGLDDVAGMINDLIAALEQEGRDAETQAQWCADEMKKVSEARDATVTKLAELNATWDTESASRDELTVEIAGLSADIAQLTKALNEETELRAEESAVNAKKLADAETGEQAVDDAISVLETYYQGVAVDDGQGVGPDDSDLTSTSASGESVNDVAPDTISNDQYAGSQSAASHVLAELQKIKQDFADAISDSNSDESQASSDYDDFKSDTDTDIGNKQTSMEDKEQDKVDAELAIKQAEDDAVKNKALLEQYLHELQQLKPACSASGAAAADRAAAREQEMQALNQGLDILQNTDFGGSVGAEDDGSGGK